MGDLEIVTEVIAKATVRPASELVATTMLNDLGLGSLDLLDLVFALETRLDLQLPDGSLDHLNGKTIADLVELIGKVRSGTWTPAASP